MRPILGVFDPRPGEAPIAALLTSLMLVAALGLGVGQASVDALFLRRRVAPCDPLEPLK